VIEQKSEGRKAVPGKKPKAAAPAKPKAKPAAKPSAKPAAKPTAGANAVAKMLSQLSPKERAMATALLKKKK